MTSISEAISSFATTIVILDWVLSFFWDDLEI